MYNGDIIYDFSTVPVPHYVAGTFNLSINRNVAHDAEIRQTRERPGARVVTAQTLKAVKIGFHFRTGYDKWKHIVGRNPPNATRDKDDVHAEDSQ